MARSIQQRVGDWSAAFDIIRRTITPDEMRLVLSTLKSREPEEGEPAEDYLRNQLKIAQQLGVMIAANDRAAAIAAAILTQGLPLEKAPVVYPEEVR